MTEDEQTGLKITDRRRFRADGTSVKDNPTVENTTTENGTTSKVTVNAPHSSDSPQTAGQSQTTGDSRSSETSQATMGSQTSGEPVSGDKSAEASSGEIRFSSFVMSLATQAFIQLGEMDPPPGLELPRDKATAKQTIDIISLLQEKTQGNLSAEESQLLVELLHNLRMAFVRAK